MRIALWQPKHAPCTQGLLSEKPLMHPSTAFATQPGAILLSGSELLLRGLVCRGTKWCAVTL